MTEQVARGYEEAIVRRGGAEGFGCYRYYPGLLVRPTVSCVRAWPELKGRGGTVVSVTERSSAFYVTVAWELPDRVLELQHPSNKLIPQRDAQGHPQQVREEATR
jgi:hypothetical protein